MLFYFLLSFSIYAVIRLSAFFSKAETAFLSASAIKLKRLKKERKRGAKAAFALHSNLPFLLSLLLLAINFFSTLLSSLSTMFFMRLTSPFFLSFSGILTSFVYTIFANIVPKTLALREPENEALKSAKILWALKIIFFPVIWIFSRFSFFTALIAAKFIPKESSSLTSEELINVFLLGEKEGALKKEEREIFSRILQFSSARLSDIMRRLSSSLCISPRTTYKKVRNIFLKTKSDFLLVKEKTKIIGIINYRDVLLAEEKTAPTSFSFHVMKKPFFLPESTKILKILDTFRENKNDFVICLDERGQPSGLVSLDEVMRLAIGRKTIRGKRKEEIFKKISGYEILVSASVKLVDVNETFNLNLKTRENTTLGGYLLEKFDEIPEEGASLLEAGYTFSVNKKNGNKLELIHIKLPSKG